MSIFKNDRETKRMIFNVYADIADRLERAREISRSFDKRLDVDTSINKALEKFLHKAEKKLEEMQRESKGGAVRTGAHAETRHDGLAQEDTTPDPSA